jgi:uncharacterized membrane protein YfcA
MNKSVKTMLLGILIGMIFSWIIHAIIPASWEKGFYIAITAILICILIYLFLRRDKK